LTRFLHANPVSTPDQVRGRLSFENALDPPAAATCLAGKGAEVVHYYDAIGRGQGQITTS